MPETLPSTISPFDPGTEREQLTQFLRILFQDVPTSLYRQCWTFPAKRSLFVQHIDERFIDQLIHVGSKGQDVYVGVGLAPDDYGPGHRCPSENIAGLVGLWADIDIKHPVHTKPNLPPTEQDAFRLIEEMGVAPTMVVHTGHGLQAWWCFREPWIFQDSHDRAQAKALAEGWGGTLRTRAKAHGWDVDAVHDLARLMRLPGLWNWKEARC